MATTEQERRRRAAALERARLEREKLRLDEKRRGDELESQRLRVQMQEQERLGAEQKSREADAERRRAKEDFDNSAGGQAFQATKTVAPPLLGLYAGHKQAAGIEARQRGMPAATQATMSTARRFAPYAARSMLFLPEGYYLRNHVAPDIESETGRDLVRAGGTGMMMAGGGLVGEGAKLSLTPQARGGGRVPAAPPSAPPAAPVSPGAQAPAASPGPQGTPPAAPRPNADRLVAAARAAGAKGPLTKATAATYLETNLTAANRAAAAAELGIKPGRNFSSRISTAVRNMASTRGISSTLLPIAAGAMAYDAVAGDAEASGADATTMRGRGALAGGVAAGTAYGGAKLAPYAANAISKSALGRVALRAVPPAAAALTAYDIGNYMAQGATPAPENDAFAEQYAKTHPRFDPDEARTARMSARQAVRMPMENAASLDIPNIRPGAAVTAERNAVANSGDFDAMLAEFVRAVEEHNAGVGNYGP
jgi:hypothetical protein